LAGELGARGFTVVTQTTYLMAPVTDLPVEVCEAFVAGRIDSVLHYSRRSARAFFQAAGRAGVEISALAVLHGCLSEAVALIAHDAGATQVVVAQTPDENALFAALDRANAPLSR
jgi:uroporphyrinogen-III synthase